MSNLEQDEMTPSPEYIKGFNEGYYIAKYYPDLSSKLLGEKAKSDRTLGFQKGILQFEVEIKLERSLDSFSKDTKTSFSKFKKDRHKDRGLDKDI